MEIKDIYEKLVHNKNKVFFGEKGLTITEASHKSNLIKERMKAVEALFNSTGAYESVMDFNSTKVPITVNQAIKLYDNCHLEGDMYGLTAWLREAVKAKTDLLSHFRMAYADDMLMPGEALPEREHVYPVQKAPSKLVQVTVDDIIGTFSIADRAEYYRVEAIATHIGKKIHTNGIIAKIREELQAGKTTSFKALPFNGGEQTYLITHTALYDKDEIETLFFKLQGEHRAANERLNWFKARIQNEMTQKNAEIREVYNKEVKALNQAYKLEVDDYNTKELAYQKLVTEQSNMLEKRRLDLTAYVAQLKVIIPHEFEKLIAELK